MTTDPRTKPVPDTWKTAALFVLLCYWAAMLVGTHIPRPEDFLPSTISDKSLHSAAYAGLTVLVLLNISLRTALRWSHFAWVLVLMAVVGLLDEVTQIPFGRTFDMLDWTANMVGAIGAAAGVALGRIVLRVGRARSIDG